MSSRRIEQIDALRALAALLVLVTHATESLQTAARAAGQPLWLYHATHAVDMGRTGVVIFFMTSGYVVAQSLDGPRPAIGDFLRRRALRLYPLYWLSVLMAATLLAPAMPPAGALAANATMLPTLFGAEPLMGLYWTLEAELVFYAVAALLASRGLLHRPAVLAGLAAVSIAVFAGWMFGWLPGPHDLAWKSWPLNFCFMLAGVLAYLCRSDHAADGGAARARAVVVGLALLPSAYVLLRYLHAGSPDDLRWGVAYPAAALLFFACLGGRLPGLRWLAPLGLVGYSLYLMHPFALWLLTGSLGAGAQVVERFGLPAASGLAVLASAALSVLTYRWVERPFMRRARRQPAPAAA